MADKVHQLYPSWRYHLVKAPKIIHSPADEATLGSGWRDTPYSDEEREAAAAKAAASEKGKKSA